MINNQKIPVKSFLKDFFCLMEAVLNAKKSRKIKGHLYKLALTLDLEGW